MPLLSFALSGILHVEEQAVVVGEGRGDAHLGMEPLPTGCVHLRRVRNIDGIGISRLYIGIHLKAQALG